MLINLKRQLLKRMSSMLCGLRRPSE